MANKLELVSSGGIPHCYNHNVTTYLPQYAQKQKNIKCFLKFPCGTVISALNFSRLNHFLRFGLNKRKSLYSSMNFSTNLLYNKRKIYTVLWASVTITIMRSMNELNSKTT